MQGYDDPLIEHPLEPFARATLPVQSPCFADNFKYSDMHSLTSHLERQLDNNDFDPLKLHLNGRPLVLVMLGRQLSRARVIHSAIVEKACYFRRAHNKSGENFDGEVTLNDRYVVLFDLASKQKLEFEKDEIPTYNAERFEKPFLIYASPKIILNDDNSYKEATWVVRNVHDIDCSDFGTGATIIAQYDEKLARLSPTVCKP